jgi:hypothetical protein
MSNKPIALTQAEIKELSASEDLQEVCGANSSKDMQEILEGAYTVKFNFINESPGYVGDLFLIQSGCLSSEIPVIRLIRNRLGKVALLDEPEAFIFEAEN